MQKGDKVQVTGVVKDIVEASVLVGADPDGHEYWFVEGNVTGMPESAPAAAETGKTPAPHTTAAPAHESKETHQEPPKHK